MSEHVSNIEDETLPNFLVDSISSSISEALDNCTLTSNLGLPVAASTVAKARNAFDRIPDVQSSYLEHEKPLLPSSNTSKSSLSDGDQNGKLVHDLKAKLDDVDSINQVTNVKAKVQKSVSPQKMLHVKEPGSESLKFLSPGSTNVMSAGLFMDSYNNQRDKSSTVESVYNDVQKEKQHLRDEDFSSSVASFLENEKLISIASLDNSSSDELDDEEFNDDQLEAYFKKLLPPGVQRGVIEGQEIQEPKRATYMEDFQMLHIRMAATGMDSTPASDDEDVELELEKTAQQYLQRERFLENTRHLAGERRRPSFRPGLEGGSSEDDSSNEMQAAPSNGALLACRLSAEGHRLRSPRASLVPGVECSLADGSSGSDDGLKISNPQVAVSWNAGSITRNVAGEEDGDFLMKSSEDRIAPVGNGEVLTECKANHSEKGKRLSLTQNSCNLDSSQVPVTQKLDSMYFSNNKAQDSRSGSESRVQLCEMLSSNFGGQVDNEKYPMTGAKKNTGSDTPDMGAANRLSDAYLSHSCSGNPANSKDSSGFWQSAQSQPFQWSFAQSCSNKGESPPHSVVYQNEEGKWVTDLAYYRSFDNEQGIRFSGSVDGFNEEGFVVGCDALAKIEEDQESFEKEHRFIQEEKMDLAHSSHNMTDTSWKMPVTGNVVLKTSQMSYPEDASYLRLSLGEFFGQRSEALGCLGGEQDVKRPSFGYHIISPEKQEPIVLLRKSDVSENSQYDDTIKSCDDTLTAEDLGCLPDDQKIASATFDIRALVHKPAEDTHVTEEHKECLTSSTEDQSVAKEHHSELKCDQISDETLLNISTIASAIANASCSTDPKELAAMIIALSNKSKNRNSTQMAEYQQSINKFFQASLEKSHSEGVIDMERYLTATVHNDRNSECESLIQSVKDFTWDLSLGFKQSLQDSAVDLTNITDVEKQDLRKPDRSKQVKIGCVKTQSANAVVKAGAVKHVEFLGSDAIPQNNSSQLRTSGIMDKVGTCDFKLKMELNKERLLQTNCSAADALKRSPLPSGGKEKRTSQLSEFSLEQKEHGSLKSCIPNPTKILKSPRRSSSCLSNDPGCQTNSMESNTIRDETLQKHVSFQPSANGTHQNIHGESKGFPDYGGRMAEEEQYSFRPSTSPLIHSSPSQDSLKISDDGSVASPQGVPSVQRFSYPDLSPELSCLSPSLSRLTYVSAIENTLQNTTVPNPENRHSNNTIELSTTIVRASPTPSEMQNAQSNNLSWQQNKVESPKKSLSGLRTVSTNISRAKSDKFSKQDGKPMEMDLQAVNALGSGLSADNYFQAQATKADNLFAWQEFAVKSNPGLSNVNILPSPLLDKCILLHNVNSNHQGMFGAGFKPVVPATDLQTLPPSVPTLLTGQSLATTAFAQHYLGSVASVPSYPMCSSSLCGTQTGYPSCTLQTQNIQSTVTGIPLNSNVGPGLLVTLPVGNPVSASQHIGHHIHQMDSQAGPPGFSQWTTRTSGFGQVLVPDEVTFPTACCVGIASQASLNIFNPNERWMQVNIGILSIAVNGEKVDICVHQCLVFKNKTIIGPRATEDLKILLLPQRSGLFQCVLSISSWPVSADTDAIVRAETMASKVVLTAVSEYPLIEVDTGKTDCLDFGDLSSGSWKTLPLKLTNRTHATVPIRLIISANATAWRCFTFSKDPTNLVNKLTIQPDIFSKMSSPSVISHVMLAANDDQEPEFLVIWVVFRAPQNYSLAAFPLAGSLGLPEEFVARVDIEVDSPGPPCILKSIPLRARTGYARIHAPKDLQTIHLNSSVGSSAKQLLPLKNAGNIAARLKIKCTNEDDFAVDPEDLFLVAGEEQVIAVKFNPQDSKPKHSVVKIMVQPSGPQYEVTLVGESDLPESRNSSAPATATLIYSDIPPILSNKQFVSWGGVALGRAVQQKLILRNTSVMSSQPLRLLIRGQDQDCFQLQTTFGPEERLTSNRELTIRPKADASIQLMFSPTRVGCMLAKLEIKQSGMKSSQPGIKFTIPLSGYGGTSNVILEDVKKLPDSYMVTLNGFLPGKGRNICFSLRNTGSRAAYVKAVCFANLQKSIIMDPDICCVTPEKFVLKEGYQEVITISYNATPNEQGLHESHTARLCSVCFFCGDEVSRLQFRRALLHKPELAKKLIAENTMLRNTRFDEEFPGENLLSEVYDLPQRPNDVHLFYGNMQKIVLSVVSSATDAGSVRSTLELHSAADSTGRNTSLDVLPVKGPQGPLLSNSNVSVHNSDGPASMWSVKPEYLMLRAPTVDTLATTGQVQIVNNSSRIMQFDLSWPAHCLTVTPQHGSIEPQRHALILVSPNPAMATKQNMLPWNGQIYVHCDNSQKIIKVQISGDTAMNLSANDRAPKFHPVLSPRLETPVHVAKPFSKSPSSKVEIKNRTIEFPKTTVGESSETVLDIENPGNEDMKWLLSSFAPPYVKGVDGSGDVYRATYIVFRCSRVSGVLAAHDRLKVPVHFFPRERGDYTQFWDLECHPIIDPHLKHKVKFQLCGEGTKVEHMLVRNPTNYLLTTDVPDNPRRRSGSEASSLKPVKDEIMRGVFASDELYTFPPTRVGESSTLKVNLQNNSFTTYMLKFISPKEPFHMKHSKYCLRAHHYINLPVKFKPCTAGKFEDCLVVQTDVANICIQLVGEALAQ